MDKKTTRNDYKVVNYVKVEGNGSKGKWVDNKGMQKSYQRGTKIQIYAKYSWKVKHWKKDFCINKKINKKAENES